MKHVELPRISEAELAERLHRVVDEPLGSSAVPALHRHYEELRRWNRRLSLIGPGTAADAIDRHYGESLAALSMIGPSDRSLLDLGSGAGFPGFVLAAACPHLQVTLVEARQRKCAFLRSATRRAGLLCAVLDARLDRRWPPGAPRNLDIVSSRAVALDRDLLELLGERTARILLWTGEAPVPLPRGFKTGRVLHLPGSDQRRIVELRRIPRAS